MYLRSTFSSDTVNFFDFGGKSRRALTPWSRRIMVEGETSYILAMARTLDPSLFLNASRAMTILASLLVVAIVLCRDIVSGATGVESRRDSAPLAYLHHSLIAYVIRCKGWEHDPRRVHTPKVVVALPGGV
jgi:hypothetical protein